MIGDGAYHDQLLELFKPDKNRLPSYSTIRRVLLSTDIHRYGECLSRFFEITPQAVLTIAVDGKVLKGSYMAETDNPNCDSHPAIMLVSAYIVERGIILPPYEVERKTNEIKALPEMIQQLALKGVVFAFDAINTQKKTCQLIIDSGNDYLGALKGNQRGLFAEVKEHFTPEQTVEQLNKGHGRIEKRTVSICRDLNGLRAWPGMNTLIRVESERQELYPDMIVVTIETRYYISSLLEDAPTLAA